MARPKDEPFPAPVYKETVLAPLFEGVKRHHWRYQMRINRASAVMLAECGLIRPSEAKAILDALDDIVATLDVAKLVYTGEHEDFFFYVESELTRRLGVAIAGKLHTGRSRNDIDHTVFKLALKERIIVFAGALIGLIETTLGVAEANRATLVVAYTHGQPAQPTTFGHYLGALIEQLLRDLERLSDAARYPDKSSMGAAAITTSGFGLDRARMADLLGFAEVQENSYGCIASVDYATSVYAQLKLLFVHLGRFVQDLNAWSGFEVGHLYVPDAYVQISSIMPQKRNPVAIEHLRLMLSLAAQRAEAVIFTVHNTPYTDMNDSEGEVQAAGYEAFDTGLRALTLIAGFLGAVRIDEAKVRRHIEEACITVTELADSLVRKEGLSFRQAHEVAALLARRMIDSREIFRTVPYGAFLEAFAAVAGREPGLTEAEFRLVTTPEHFIEVRTMPGGPAPASLSASFERYRRQLDQARSWLNDYRGRMEQAAERLDEAASRLQRG
ncbi:MAG: argininosuccinate lyase [Proteobacteria bacterium]|nr:argininosuccinate lyase [Pseudomonadota bacterium]MBI3496804.1 argininosuccinate lyase [Pseudomonadota bacterium]